MFRAIGAILVFLGCSAAGFSAAYSLKRERDLLRAFAGALTLLRSGVAYGAQSIAELFSEAAETAPAPLSGLFRDLSASVAQRPGERLSEHVNVAVCAYSEAVPLPVREAMRSLGAALGGSDTEGQLHAIALCEERIRAAERSAEASLPERGRMRRTLGVCLGAAIAILFL